MTFSSLDLRRYPLGTTADDLDHYGTESTKLMDLDLFSGGAGPYKVADWATARDLPRHWVDSAWVRVPVTKADVLALVRDLLGADDAAAASIASRIGGDDGVYVIDAEEF